MTPALRRVLGVESEMQQRVVMLARHHLDVAAASPIATARPAPRNVLLAPERKTAVAPVSRLHADSDFIDKHWWNFERLARKRKEKRRLGQRLDTDELPRPAAIAKFHDSRHLCEQSIVFAAPDIVASFEQSAALPHQNRPARH